MEKISSIIPGISAGFLQKNKFHEQIIFLTFRRVVGNQVAEKVVPVEYSHGILQVRCESKRWESLFSKLCEETDLIAKLNRTIGKKAIKKINIWKT